MMRNLGRILGVLAFALQLLLPDLRADDCIPPPAGLVDWWSGDGHFFDLSTNHHNGVGMNGVGFAPGKVQQAFCFDGVDDGIVPDGWTFVTNIQNPFTMEFWAYPNAGRDSTPETNSSYFEVDRNLPFSRCRAML